MSDRNNLPDYVYVASSWRNPFQPHLIQLLKDAEIDHYDFRNPEGGTGFHWSEVMPNWDREAQLADKEEYLTALSHNRSVEGFNSDFEAMKRADTFILLLPCGRSAHLELGWAVGAGKRTAILLDPDLMDRVTPELMYKMVDMVTWDTSELFRWLGVKG